MNKNTKMKARNRSAGVLVYTIPDLNNRRRVYAPNEVKEVPFEELEKLSYQPGGMHILKHYLTIDNVEARTELLGSVELEYNYTEKEIKDLLLTGSLDQLLDCLDFAPAGVIDLVKELAVKLEISDLRKRDAILKSTGFDVTKAIELEHIIEEPDDGANGMVVRRVQNAGTAPASSETAKPARRFTATKTE